jgi:hypothetical protein
MPSIWHERGKYGYEITLILTEVEKWGYQDLEQGKLCIPTAGNESVKK